MKAKSAFVVNDGVWFKVFNKFYAELVKWNRFRLVQRRENADITIVLSNTPGTLAGGVAVPNGGVFIGGSESKFYMRVADAKDGTPLWADVTGEAGLCRTQQSGWSQISGKNGREMILDESSWTRHQLFGSRLERGCGAVPITMVSMPSVLRRIGSAALLVGCLSSTFAAARN